MDGKYLASNNGPLKVLGEGIVFITINDLLNTNRFESVELVAYSIRGYDSRIITIDCLFKKEGEFRTLFFRDFDFFKRNNSVSDELKLTADHGIGIGEYTIENFLKLRDFYLEHSMAPAAEIS
jgi:hypothetical protein